MNHMENANSSLADSVIQNWIDFFVTCIDLTKNNGPKMIRELLAVTVDDSPLVAVLNEKVNCCMHCCILNLASFLVLLAHASCKKSLCDFVC